MGTFSFVGAGTIAGRQFSGQQQGGGAGEEYREGEAAEGGGGAGNEGSEAGNKGGEAAD